MLGLVGLIGNIGTLAGGYLVAKWGLKVALIGAVVSSFTVVWVAIMAMLGAAVALMPSSPVAEFGLQFLPSSGSVSTAVSLVCTTAVGLRTWDFWLQTFGITAKIGAA